MRIEIARLKLRRQRAHQMIAVLDGLRMAMAEPPDLVLASARLDGQSAAPFLRALRRDERLAHVPILLLQSTDSAAERLALLRAGADAVLTRPVPEPLLLARLRNLLRARNAEEELIGQTGGAPGFAESQAALALPGQVTLFAPDRAAALALRARFAETMPHRLSFLALDDPPPASQDLFVIRLGQAQAEAMVALLQLKS